MSGRWRVGKALVALLVLGSGKGGSLGAQESLLEAWTLSYLAESWALRTELTESATTGPRGRTRIQAGVDFDVLSLGPSLTQRGGKVSFSARHPLGSRVGVRIAGAGSRWETRRNESPLFDTPQSEAAAVGIYADLPLGSPWSLQAEAQAAWDRGFGGVGRVALVGPRHALTVTGWRANSRSSRVVLPADSLRDIGMSHRVLGVRVQAATTLTVGVLSISPALHWEEERVAPGRGDADGFLQASPDGKSSMRGLGISAAAGRWTIGGQYRHRDLDLESSILRAGGSAGRVAYTRLSLDAWSAAASAARSHRVWSLEVGGERLDGALSARVETWPFATLWETLSVQAFRLQGGLDGRSIWWRFRNEGVSRASWDWGADVGRYVLRTDRDSWYVTSFGFGRSDRQTTTGGADPAIVVGGMLGRSFPFGAGDMKVRLVAGMPVHAAAVGRTPLDDAKSPQALVGYLALSAEWVR